MHPHDRPDDAATATEQLFALSRDLLCVVGMDGY